MPTLLVALAALTLAQADVSREVSPVEPGPESRRFELFTAAGLGARPGQAAWGGTAAVGVTFRIFSWLRPEVLVGYGLYDGPFELVTLIRAGTRLELPLAFPFRPYLWVAFAHNHEVGVDMVGQHPFETMLGTSENGVTHRTGGELGLGLSYDFVQFRRGAIGFRVNLRASAALFTTPGPLYGDLVSSLGFTF